MEQNISELLQYDNLLANQNKLLEQINNLLIRQNKILQQKNVLSSSVSEENFVENLYRDEMRSGFLVTSHRKKLWNAQIGMIKEIERICKKHNIRWFIHGGTLLGAVRHKGYIPWDDDADVALLRPDYEKFRKVVADEVRDPYFFDPWYNYRTESDKMNGINDDENLPVISLAWQKHGPTWWPFWPILRIKDRRTTTIVRPGLKSMPQYAYVDILPFDPVPPFTNERQNKIFQVALLLLVAAIVPDMVKQQINNGVRLELPKEELIKFMQLPFRKRALQWENFMAENFFSSQYVSEFKVFCIDERKGFKCKIEDFETTVDAPFEKVQFPAPVGYDDVLTAAYGDWHKFKIFPSPVSDYSTNISYDEYAQKSGFMK